MPKFPKFLLLTSASILALSACARDVPLHSVGSMLLPDGHSSYELISGGVCADPQCFTQDTVTGGVHTFWQSGRLVSEVRDLRPVTAPSGAYATAQLLVPSVIQGAGNVGAGALVAHGIGMAGKAEALGTYSGDVAMGKGEAALGKAISTAKPPTISVSATGGTATGGMAYSTSSAVSSATSQVTNNNLNLNNNSARALAITNPNP